VIIVLVIVAFMLLRFMFSNSRHGWLISSLGSAGYYRGGGGWSGGGGFSSGGGGGFSGGGGSFGGGGAGSSW
jgi:uncharacterized protein